MTRRKSLQSRSRVDSMTLYLSKREKMPNNLNGHQKLLAFTKKNLKCLTITSDDSKPFAPFVSQTEIIAEQSLSFTQSEPSKLGPFDRGLKGCCLSFKAGRCFHTRSVRIHRYIREYRCCIPRCIRCYTQLLHIGSKPAYLLTPFPNLFLLQAVLMVFQFFLLSLR